jgi:dihydrolipoamide dehydrogenase
MYDILVIGSGPAGYVAAIKAAQLGFKVACVEKEGSLGGTCLNVGCIPSKSLLHSTEIGGKDLAILMKEKEGVVQKLSGGISYLFKKNKVDHIQGTALVKSSGIVEVNGKLIEAKYVIVAVGSEAVPLPFLPFDETIVLSSTGALALKEIPKKMLIVGGGVIGLELGSVYRRLGTEVEVIEFMDRIIPEFDLDLSKAFQKTLENQGFVFNLNTKVIAGRKNSNGITLEVDGGKTFSGDVCLVAIGRKPYTNGMELKLNGRGFIETDENFRTSAPNVFAIGDVAGPPMLAHKGSYEAVALIEYLAGKSPCINYLAIPNVIYTYPEVASVGFSEKELKEKKIPYKAATFPFTGSSRYQANSGKDPCFIKILSHAETRHLIGAHILSPNASELIIQPTTAIQNKMTLDQLKNICFPHPTLSEAFHEVYIDKFLHM